MCKYLLNYTYIKSPHFSLITDYPHLIYNHVYPFPNMHVIAFFQFNFVWLIFTKLHWLVCKFSDLELIDIRFFRYRFGDTSLLCHPHILVSRENSPDFLSQAGYKSDYSISYLLILLENEFHSYLGKCVIILNQGVVHGQWQSCVVIIKVPIIMRPAYANASLDKVIFGFFDTMNLVSL